MRAKKTDLQPADATEKAFLDAIERLVAGKPANAGLLKALENGKLKTNVSTVALEAGHSRTLIAYKGCKYPRVRDRIRALTSDQPSPYSKSEVLTRLREENSLLQVRLQQSISQNAALIRRMHVLEQQLKAEKTRGELARNNRGPNQVVGQMTPAERVNISLPEVPKE